MNNQEFGGKKKSLSYGLSHSFKEKETISYCGSDILDIEAEMSFTLVATCEQIRTEAK